MSQTCLASVHRRLNAVMVDFHGWEMPIRYTQIPQEHQAVRNSAGLFDLCHMGRLEFTGPEAEDWVQSTITQDISQLQIGRARYSLLCNPRGGILDDLIVYRLEDRLFMVVNAGNRERVVAWFLKHRDGRRALLSDVSRELAMLALQGPDVNSVMAPLVDSPERPLEALPYYHITRATILGHAALVASTGYTGERGFEVFLPSTLAAEFWNTVLEEAGKRVAPIGLGARDTLRVEAGMPLYGNELGEEINPYEAGLGGVVKLKKSVSFIGKEALATVQAQGPRRKLVGFRVNSRRIARQGMTILQGGQAVGVITSGIPSPTLGYPVAMGYVDNRVASPEDMEVDIRGNRVPIVPEALPFFSRTRKKAARAL